MLVVCSTGILMIFWEQELKYNMPTPVPTNYREIKTGTTVNLTDVGVNANGPFFLHFYNPDCPCSRFNARHVKSLIRQYGDSVTLYIVVPGSDAIRKAKTEFGTDQNYITDHDGRIAAACGVYSTPQAVIIDGDNTLYYRGNYNAARYCTSRATNFAELSLIALLSNQEAPPLPLVATTSYGCELETEKAGIPIF